MAANWEAAAAACQALPGGLYTLSSLNDVEEKAAYQQALPPSVRYWIGGLNSSEASWIWINGDTWNWPTASDSGPPAWQVGQPNYTERHPRYTLYDSESGGMNDEACVKNDKRHLCERP